jgi:hypothetical protein
MNIRRVARTLTTSLAASALIAAGTGTAWAQHGGGGHVGGVGFHGGVAIHSGPGVHGGAVFHGGIGYHGYPGYPGYPGYAGYHGYPAYRGYYGYHGYGWGWRPGYGWWWWGWGLPLGVYLTTLPYYYSTNWWNGVPYYYTNGGYYLWNNTASQYEQVQPPTDLAQQSGVTAAPELYAYPTHGQSAEQQERDKSDCRAWASGQVTGVPPSTPNGPNAAATSSPPVPPGPAPAAGTTAPAGAPTLAAGGQDYLRAQGACLEARGYSVR